MRIDRRHFDALLTQNQVDEYINSLLLDLDEFSDIACIHGKAFGVTMPKETCTSTQVNACLRNALVRLLWSSQRIAEDAVGFLFTERYHTEDVPFVAGISHVKLAHTGISALNVKRQFTTPVNFGPFDISPFLLQDIPVSDSSQGFCIVELDGELVRNPNTVTIRDDSYQTYPVQNRNGFPRKNDSGNWELALDKGVNPPCSGVTLHAQAEYMILEVTPPVLADGVELVPVYPNSNQIIPLARDPEPISGGDIRYWFRPWVLVDDAFADEEIDLSKRDFYKLLSTIEFKLMSEAVADPVLTIQRTDLTTGETEFITHVDGDDDVSLSAVVWDANLGVVRYTYGVDVCVPIAACSVDEPKSITISYRTDPTTDRRDDYLQIIKRAIAYLVAADAPNASCGCSTGKGTGSNADFFAQAQSPYTQVRINPLTNEKIENTEFGDRFGQLVFRDHMKRIAPKRKVVHL